MKIKDIIFSKRRLLFSLFALLCGSLILTQSILATRATDSEIKEATASAEATGEADLKPPVVEAVTEEIDYYLPYPGILPDHPLYWLKMARDRVFLWLTRDPTTKLERLLLYADKRIGAAEALIKGGKSDLGLSTASKAEKYLEQAVDQLEVVKNKDKDKAERLEELLGRATLKHKEVLEGVLEKVPEQAKSAIERAIESSERGFNRVMEVRERKIEKETEKIEEKLEEELDKMEKTESKDKEKNEDKDQEKEEEKELEAIEKEMEEIEETM